MNHSFIAYAKFPCAYQGVGNNNFSEDLAYVLNK